MFTKERQQKDMINMRYSVFGKKKGKRTAYRGRQAFQVEHKKQVSDAFGVLPPLHNLHSCWLSLWPGPEQRLQGHPKDRAAYKKVRANPKKMHNKTKRLRTPEEAERHFPGFLSFTDCTENSRHQGLKTGEEERHTTRERGKCMP